MGFGFSRLSVGLDYLKSLPPPTRFFSGAGLLGHRWQRDSPLGCFYSVLVQRFAVSRHLAALTPLERAVWTDPPIKNHALRQFARVQGCCRDEARTAGIHPLKKTTQPPAVGVHANSN